MSGSRIVVGQSSPWRQERDRAVADGSVVPSGWFVHHHDGDRWQWSDGLAKMYGYEPGAVIPTTDLLLSHRHPDDVRRDPTALEPAVCAHQELAVQFRMIDRHRGEHLVIANLEPLTDRAGRSQSTRGRCVDVTGLARVAFDREVIEFRQHRARIEQVKGFLMVVCAMDEDAAFALLQWYSQVHNVKLWVIAERVAARLPLVRLDGEWPCAPQFIERMLLDACADGATDSA